MQLRDAGRLDLDDRLEQHLDGVANGSPTIRRLLCHLSGLQREAGEMFVTGDSPTEEQLIDSMRRLELVLPPGEAHHYSNLAFALLGQVVARASGQPYTDYVDERIIRPLGLDAHDVDAAGAEGAGLPRRRVRAHRLARAGDRPRRRRRRRASSGRPSRISAAGRRSSRAAHDGVLDAATIEEMWFPQVMYYPDNWMLGWGLGLMLVQPATASIYGGHGGAMAGHLAGVYVDRKTQIGARGADELGHARRHGADRDRARGEGDRALAGAGSSRGGPRQEPPADVAAAARPLVVGGERVRLLVGGRRAAGAGRRRAAGPRARRRSSATATAGRAAVGRERGERLRVEGDRLIWAGYAFTRAQEPFTA